MNSISIDSSVHCADRCTDEKKLNNFVEHDILDRKFEKMVCPSSFFFPPKSHLTEMNWTVLIVCPSTNSPVSMWHPLGPALAYIHRRNRLPLIKSSRRNTESAIYSHINMRYYISTIYIIGWLGGTWVVLIIARHVSRHYRPPFTLCYIILTKDASNNFRSISPPHLFFSSTNHFHIVTYSPCPALGE